MLIETIELFGFVSAIKALRLPFKGKSKSDSIVDNGICRPIRSGGCNLPNTLLYENCLTYGTKDLNLMQSLIKAGDEHAKVVRGINITCSITAPRYWWVEMDTYRCGTERLCSESTMHVEAHGLTGEELQKAKAELKEGHEQERIQMFSYQTLRRIYKQRKTHRLPEWQTFCTWIEGLPLAKELILIGLDK